MHKRVQRALAALRVRVVAAGAAEGLQVLSHQVQGQGQEACIATDPYTWLLIAAASKQRRSLLEALLAPIHALVSALNLDYTGPRYYASSVRRTWFGQALYWSYGMAAELAAYLAPRIWRRQPAAPRSSP